MYFEIDNRGNIITGTTLILIVSLVLMVIFIVNSINYMENENINSISSDNFKYIIQDYKDNLGQLGKDSLAEETEKVYFSWLLFKFIKKFMSLNFCFH